jgi:transketolase
LGQGVGNSVGMAIAGVWMAAHFNRPGFTMFDYNVYAICGDGDVMEGVACEAASLAGHLKLPNLCWIYDNNRVTLDGPADESFTEDVAARFRAYGWNVGHVADANDLSALSSAYEQFLQIKDRPTLIVLDSHIGYGSPHKQDSNAAHGEPLGEEKEILRLARGRQVPGAGWGPRPLSRWPGQARPRSPRTMDEPVRRIRKEISRPGRPSLSHAAP